VASCAFSVMYSGYAVRLGILDDPIVLFLNVTPIVCTLTWLSLVIIIFSFEMTYGCRYCHTDITLYWSKSSHQLSRLVGTLNLWDQIIFYFVTIPASNLVLGSKSETRQRFNNLMHNTVASRDQAYMLHTWFLQNIADKQQNGSHWQHLRQWLGMDR